MLRAFQGALPNEFENEEQFRIYLYFQAILGVQQSLFRAVSEGILSEEFLPLVSGAGAFNNHYFRTIWFGGISDNYTSDFIVYFESLDWNVEL